MKFKQSIRMVWTSYGMVLRHGRAWLTFWFVLSLVALLVLLTSNSAADAHLSHHPGQTFLLNQSLDTDLARLHPESIPQLGGAMLFSLLVGLFLAGGVMTCVGTGRRLGYSGFLAESARFFVRNLRILFFGLLAIALAFSPLLLLQHWLETEYWRNSDVVLSPSFLPWLFNLRVLVEVLGALQAFLFLIMLFLTKVAMASLNLRQGKSALLACSVALFKMLRYPMQICLLVLLWTFLHLGVSAAIGEALVRVLEVNQNTSGGLLLSQLAYMWTAISVLALFVVARQFVTATTKVKAELQPVAEAPAEASADEVSLPDMPEPAD